MVASWIGFYGVVLSDISIMKILENIYEWIIIVLAIFLLLVPEIAYSCLLRTRDKVIDMYMEVK